MKRGWAFIAAAAIPCFALLLFCAVGAREWWLITTHQIVVIPAIEAGSTSAHEVPAGRLLPVILGSAALAALFGWALLRGSRRVLVAAYLAVALVAGGVALLRVW